ncbi:transcription factor 20-like [Panonychus citri]|uniref:transcription factor 20-like n=1 Tax=Panonychus citri TaxID=50023 RepID=UPI002307431C|nr:transcription factor 20-like [Panonychus citri]
MDNPWICVFCQQRSHYKGMGDLFGPYFIPVEIKSQSNQWSANGDNKMDEVGTWIKQESVCSSSTSDNQLRSRLTYEKRRCPEGDSPDAKRRLIVTNTGLELTSIPSTTINRINNNNNNSNNNNSNGGNSTSQREVWFHEDCLVWSNGVYLVGHRIRNIEEVIKDCSENICCECKLKGAPLGCLRKGCSPRFHYLCAKEKGCDMDEENFSIHCPKHQRI